MAAVVNRLARLRPAVERWRVPVTIVAATAFVAGLALSIGSLDLHLSDVSIEPVLLILLVFAPLSLAAAAFSLQLTARTVGRHIHILDAVAASAIGRLVDVLPLPGGALVRGSALLRSGAGLGESAWIVTLTAFLTLSMAAALGSVPLIVAGLAPGYFVLVAGVLGMTASLIPIARRAGARMAAAMVSVRIVNLGIGVARFSVAFSAIGVAVEPLDAALFVICAALGTSVAIVPAGLGVSEAIAAALALLVDVPPAAAFVATALNRVLGLAAAGIVALAFTVKMSRVKPD